MLKKKLLLSLVIFQGILILVGIIAIIFGVFYKLNTSKSSLNKIKFNTNLNDIYLFDKNHYQQKIIKNNRAIFQIIEIKSKEVKKEIIID